jgi:hypothetical protein
MPAREIQAVDSVATDEGRADASLVAWPRTHELVARRRDGPSALRSAHPKPQARFRGRRGRVVAWA